MSSGSPRFGPEPDRLLVLPLWWGPTRGSSRSGISALSGIGGRAQTRKTSPIKTSMVETDMTRIHSTLQLLLQRLYRAGRAQRRFVMMDLDELDPMPLGPGWFDSSWELEQGLEICEDAAADVAFQPWREPVREPERESMREPAREPVRESAREPVRKHAAKQRAPTTRLNSSSPMRALGVCRPSPATRRGTPNSNSRSPEAPNQRTLRLRSRATASPSSTTASA
mgnify:CR=1 FL=1